MPSTPRRIAVVGAGYIGRAHIEAIGRLPELALSAIVDPAATAADLAAHLGTPCYPSLDEMLHSDRPHGIVLASPNTLHVEQAMQCLAARVPMLLEKPLSPTVSEGTRLVAAIEQSSVPVLIGHHRAHSPIMRRARETINSGALGRLVAVTGSAVFYKPERYFEAGPWRREAGGGPILLNMIHEVHNLRMLCGEVVAVQAIASNAVRGFPVEDTVAISLCFASGALGTFLLSDTAASARSWEQTSGENPAYPHYPDEDCYLIAGTQGSLAVPTMRVKRYAAGQEPSWWNPFELDVVDTPRHDPLLCQMQHFAEVLRGDAQPLVSARDGLRNLTVTEAIVQAARSGQRIDLCEASPGAGQSGIDC